MEIIYSILKVVFTLVKIAFTLGLIYVGHKGFCFCREAYPKLINCINFLKGDFKQLDETDKRLDEALDNLDGQISELEKAANKAKEDMQELDTAVNSLQILQNDFSTEIEALHIDNVQQLESQAKELAVTQGVIEESKLLTQKFNSMQGSTQEVLSRYSYLKENVHFSNGSHNEAIKGVGNAERSVNTVLR